MPVSFLRHRTYEVAATLIGGATLALLSVFLIAEVSGGNWSGLAHLLQVAPLAALLALGWRLPKWSGVLLLVIGGVLALAYFVETSGATVPAAERLVVAGIFLVPPMVAGALFLIAAHRHSRGAEARSEPPLT